MMLHKRIQMIISKLRPTCSLIALTTMAWLCSSCMVPRVAGCDGFDELFQPNWAPEHFDCEGDQTKLTLDSSSGCGFGSRKTYLFGLTSVQIKLVRGDSAGTVTAFYMSSDGHNHDELDFEFLGNRSGEPYLVQTNVYVDGTGDREQRHSLWFDPTVGFHTYSLFWNRRFIMFLVDGILIRVFTNKEESHGVPYPKSRPMRVRGSVWNADDWATQGGRVKTNWSHEPFVSSFRSFGIDACELSPETDDIATRCGQLGHRYWWDEPSFDEVGRRRSRSRQLRWVRKKHLVYDYCEDKLRFTELPKECMD